MCRIYAIPAAKQNVFESCRSMPGGYDDAPEFLSGSPGAAFDPLSQVGAIQVGTPSRGRMTRITTIQITTKTMT